MTKALIFKWTVSRARDTYGYNVCSLWVDGKKVSSCNGGGYDMNGTCLADWMDTEHPDKLTRLRANYGSGDNGTGFYGLVHWNKRTKKRQKRASKHTKTYLDGACGFSAMERVLNKLGHSLKCIFSKESAQVYILT